MSSSKPSLTGAPPGAAGACAHAGHVNRAAAISTAENRTLVIASSQHVRATLFQALARRPAASAPASRPNTSPFSTEVAPVYVP